MNLLILNGPNLNLLGNREPEIYGSTRFESYVIALQQKFPTASIHYTQSNVEGELINALHQANNVYQGVVLNAGAYTHTSIAIADAVAALSIPVVEVHISNIFARETYRHVSFVGKHCKGSISGFGLQSYDLAVRWLMEQPGA
ncbi:MAG: type II 3-dehydroquinate dehydratase [Bacteroidetes bacterium]|nr:type II 3-dehydroquinate dehydratase [Bacteroidota bacterium]